MKLFGIKNCNNVKNARSWLESRGIEYEFHDLKNPGISQAILSEWLKQVGWKRLVKKTGPTWGQLPDEIKAGIVDNTTALALMMEKPNIIKRPVLEQNGRVLATGFNESEYNNLNL